MIEAVRGFETQTRAAKLITQYILLRIGKFKCCSCGILAILSSAATFRDDLPFGLVSLPCNLWPEKRKAV